MSIATLTSKGQITVPRDVRKELGLEPGTKVSFVHNAEGDIVVQRVGRSVKELSGALPYSGPALTIHEMDEAVGKAVLRAQR